MKTNFKFARIAKEAGSHAEALAWPETSTDEARLKARQIALLVQELAQECMKASDRIDAHLRAMRKARG